MSKDHAIDRIDWKVLKGKEARGVNENVDFGEIHEMGNTYIVTKKGLATKDTYYLPKALAQKYDGRTVWFNITQDQKGRFRREYPPSDEEYSKYNTSMDSLADK
ncbi:hypothetical protein NTE_00339 [Candidatus Nitrososphaera evergladensis SR1]|uniref:Uncharacterized protein n=1 Tax=Candidatus Nitrososphaera evergladensis SR1 TaxID=1459636 RepID=A0A075MLQ1_9ARCH|nr:hypothetical protein [Candidatus Nitrososphaera evergladensis]AIF82421.1 hypothetical protein NTE_00339 [Candidatus Nitrososphaera evergladensis SR1]